jgi:amidase
MLRHKEISSRELTEMLLARIDAVNPALNAVVELRPEAALQEAAAADQVIAQGAVGPLQGVPMTIKESFNVAGLHTTWGNPAFKDYVADSDATVVRRLKQAGAIIVGKTNLPFMLADFGQTANELYGVTNNPWDRTRTPGGSSGGAAAALSAGMTFLEYGSDLVGSIRIPASFCGVYGLKPSVGVVPLTGFLSGGAGPPHVSQGRRLHRVFRGTRIHEVSRNQDPRSFQPPGPPAGPSDMTYMSAVGPLGRSARDLRTAMNVTAGPEPPAANVYTWTLSPPRHARLEDFRVGVVLDHDYASVSSEITTLLSSAVDALIGAGATVVEGWPEDVDPVQQYESFGFHVQLFFAFQQRDEHFAKVSEFIDREHQRMAARAAWSRYFNDIDVFLCPANFTPAFPHDSRPFEDRRIATPEGERPYNNQAFWISHASLAGLPAVAAPIGRTPGGLPVGAQIIGPLYEDGTALEFAELLGDVIGGYKPPPT